MILVGSQRGGAGDLAAHLLEDRKNDRDKENDHITVHELRGFVADDLRGALKEIDAISKGTRCKQALFSLSLNPPKDAEIGIDTLVDAVDRAEQALGLTGQPRAIVVHEKKGRRHIHVVWSRIDAQEMKAVNLPYFKNRLSALSKELYLEHGWELPDGHKTNGWKNPLNFSLAEWQQAKRLDLDPREIKQVFQSAWQRSDNLASFRHAMEEHGYFLAKGDRRGFVALDIQGKEVFAVARWVGVKTKQVAEKLGSPDQLPEIDAVRADTRAKLNDKVRSHLRDDRAQRDAAMEPERRRVAAMVAQHHAERVDLRAKQEARWRIEAKARSEHLHTGVRGVWELLTGRTFAVRRENERAAYQAHLRDHKQRETLFTVQMKERKALQQRIDILRTRDRQERMRLVRRIATVLRISRDPQAGHAPSPQRNPRPRNLDLSL